MLASCDTPDSDWGTLLVCVGVIFLIVRHLRADESEDDTERPGAGASVWNVVGRLVVIR